MKHITPSLYDAVIKQAEFMDSAAGSAVGTGAALGGGYLLGKSMLAKKLAPLKKGLDVAKGVGKGAIAAGGLAVLGLGLKKLMGSGVEKTVSNLAAKAAVKLGLKI